MKQYLRDYFKAYLGELFIESFGRKIYRVWFDNQTTFNSQVVFNPNFRRSMHNLGFTVNYCGNKGVCISKIDN